MAVRERQTWFLLAGFFAIAVVLATAALITWQVVHSLANVGRSDGDQEILLIEVPDDWSRGKITYQKAGPDGLPNWHVIWTSSSDVQASSAVFDRALHTAGWHPCGQGLPCWHKGGYELTLEVSSRNDCSAGVCTDFVAMMTSTPTRAAAASGPHLNREA
jgi:hypothetical protein